MQSNQFKLHAEIEDKHWWFVARRRIMRDLIHRIVAPSKDVLVVDVGCGTGGNIAALGSDYSCLGIDTSQEAIGLAKESYPHVEFKSGVAPADLGDAAAKADVYLL